MSGLYDGKGNININFCELSGTRELGGGVEIEIFYSKKTAFGMPLKFV